LKSVSHPPPSIPHGALVAVQVLSVSLNNPHNIKGFIYAHILTAQWRGPAAMPFVLVRNFYKSLVLSFLGKKCTKIDTKIKH
jgi:hypothetical protein